MLFLLSLRKITCWQSSRLSLLLFFILAAGLTAPGMAQGVPGCTGMPQNMPLSPNSRSVSTASGDINSDTEISLQILGKSYWFALLSSANVHVSLGKDVGNAVVAFKQGLKLSMIMNSPSEYLILLDGSLIDDMTEYNLTGKVIAIFHCTQVSQLVLETPHTAYAAPASRVF